MRKIFTNTVAVATAVVAVVGIAAVSVALRTHAGASTGDARVTAATASAVGVSYPEMLPAGYGSVTGLAASASGDDAWYFAESATRDTLFRFSASTRQLREYQLPVSTALRAGMYTPIAVEGTDQAWIGINSSLVHVNGTSGAVTVRSLATPAIASSEAGHLPFVPQGYTASAFEGIQAMTVTADGTLYIGRLFASALQAYDTKTGALHDVALPAGSVLEGIGNDLAAGAGDAVTAVLSRSASGSVAIAAEQAGTWHFVATPGCAAQSVAQGVTATVLLGASCATRMTGSMAEPLVTQRWRLNGTGVALSAASTVLGTTTGAILVRDGAVTTVSLGKVSDAGISLPYNPRNPHNKGIPTVVPVTFWLTAGADTSHVWFVPAGGASRIGLVTVG